MPVSNTPIELVNPTIKFQEILIVASLFLGVFIIGADSFIISPLLFTIGESFNATVDKVGWGVSIYAICYAIGAPFFGPLGDQLSRKTMLIAGLITFILGTILCGFAWNLTFFYLFRAIAGVGAALFTPNVWAFIGGYFSGKKMGKIMGIVMSALSLSIALGVPIGSGIAQVSNWKWTFFSSAILSLVSLLIIIVTIPYSRNKQEEKFNYFQQFSQVFKTENAISALLVTLTWMFAFYSVYTYLGPFVQKVYEYTTVEVGLVFLVYGLGNFIASFMGGWILSNLGAKKSLILNGVVVSLVMACIPFWGINLPGLIVLLAILAFAQGFGVTSLVTYIATVVPASRSTMMALNNSFIYLGLTVGSAVGGLIWAESSFTTLVFVAAIINFTAVLIAAKLKTPKIS